MMPFLTESDLAMFTQFPQEKVPIFVSEVKLVTKNKSGSIGNR